MNTLLDELPRLIRAELARRGMSQRDLAAELDISSSTITRLTRGQGMCDVATFVRIAAWLRVEPADFADERNRAAYVRGYEDCAERVQAAIYSTIGDDDD